MENRALKYEIVDAINNIVTRKHGEYATLEEIYEEVAKIKEYETNTNREVAIRVRLQEGCSLYENYTGKEELFETPKAYSGKWKNRTTRESELLPIIMKIVEEKPGIDLYTLKEDILNEKYAKLKYCDKLKNLEKINEILIEKMIRNFSMHTEKYYNQLIFRIESGKSRIYLKGRNYYIKSCNIDSYNIKQAYEELDEIDWRSNRFDYEVGDIVYIYVTEGYNQIKYKTMITKVNIPYDKLIDDNKYVLKEDTRSIGPSIRLMKIREYDDNCSYLGKESLTMQSFKLQMNDKISHEVVNYIENEEFDIIDANDLVAQNVLKQAEKESAIVVPLDFKENRTKKKKMIDSNICIDRKKVIERMDNVVKVGIAKVLEREREKLKNFPDLQEKIKDVSDKKDIGYDIISYLEDGSQMYIGVKTSSAINSDKHMKFELSANENDNMRNKENYYIYFVYRLENPKIKIITKEDYNKMKLTACRYEIDVNCE